MQISTILFIILAAVVALGLVLFQYYYKTKRRGKIIILLSFLRFIGFFGILMLLINPKFIKKVYSVEKANLVVLVDNSSSVSSAKNDLATALENITTNQVIEEQFKVSKYTFGSALKEFDSLSFTDKTTNITTPLAALDEVYAHNKTAVVMLTDGNQTIGQDYGYYAAQLKFPIYPIAVGDTTQYEDLQISNVNSNKFAFLKNKYPVEIEIAYTGKNTIQTSVDVLVNGKSVYTENIKLSPTSTVKTIAALLTANTVGVKNVKVVVRALENERNTKNNSKNIAVEVIDEKTNIAIISAIEHPDIGVLKKAIESNEQRSVTIKKPTVSLKTLDDVDVFILYQPEASFAAIYRYIQQKKASVFTITGEKVDANFLNNIQKGYRIEGGYPIQETFAVLNSGFTKFDISDFSVDDFPPLSNGAGLIDAGNAEALMQMKILGRTLDSPLLLAVDNNGAKEMALFGENIWKWRMQSYREYQHFENFDAFIGKLMLYLSSNKTKNRLNVEYQNIYEGSGAAKIKASYFDEAFVFDGNATVILKLKNSDTGTSKEIPMVLKGNFYEADLSNFTPASYSFTVTVKGENRSQSGKFTILDFDVEQQFLATDAKKLKQLASATNGELYFPNEVDALVKYLTSDNQFIPTQKSSENTVSLIDFRILLAIIIAALSAEWFIRKYNGLI